MKDCVLPTDQAGTLTGKWKNPPVPIALQTSGFSATETAEIAKAVATWNDFFAASLSFQMIDPGNNRVSNISLPNTSTLCGQSGIVSGNGYSAPVVIYKDSTWPSGYSTAAMALTSYCRSTTKPIPTFTMAVMELNYQNYWTGGKTPDLQTIVLHELGHLVGLNHSCDNTGATGVPACNASTNPDYLNAVMYPVFGFDSSGNGQQRRALTDNDEGRANCLYQ